MEKLSDDDNRRNVVRSEWNGTDPHSIVDEEMPLVPNSIMSHLGKNRF